MYFCISVFVTLAHVASNLKCLNHESTIRKKLGPQNTLEKKILTHEIPPRKSFGPTSTHEKNILVPRNTHEGTVTRWH